MKFIDQMMTALCLSIFLMTGCQPSKNKQVPNNTYVIDFTAEIDEKSVSLSALFDDIKVVRLETTADALIENFWGYVGDRYIISIGPESILQFGASDGKFIGKIANKGHGPGEYAQLDAWTVDDGENHFIYHDRNKNYINTYNLNSNALQKNIPFQEHGSLSRMLSMNDTTLAILPAMFSGYGYLYFYQSVSGYINAGIKKDPVPHPGAWAGRSPIFEKGIDNSILYQSSESDTVFRIDGNQMQPLISFIEVKPSNNGDKSTGVYNSIMYMGKNRIFLSRSGYETTITSTFSTIKMLYGEYLVYNKKNDGLYKIQRVYFDDLDIELTNPTIKMQQNNRFFIPYLALEFKGLLDNALEDGTVPEPKRSRLMKLRNGISDYDNPVLITGKIR